MDKVTVVRPMLGIAHMIACCEKDATDAEILEACNRLNPSGTTGGWASVIREGHRDDFWNPVGKLCPVKCSDDENRLHIVVGC